MRKSTTLERDARALVAGRLLLALRTGMILDSTWSLDWWRTLDGHIDIEWQGGPFPYEVAAELVNLAADDEVTTEFVSGDLDQVTLSPAEPQSPAVLWLKGVRVRLRALEPLGRTECEQRELEAIRATGV